MAKGSIRDLKDDEIIRFLRFSVTESAAATFTEQDYDTQLSIDRGLIWMVHFIEVDANVLDLDEVAAGGNESINLQICRESQSDILAFNDSDVIYSFSEVITRSAAIGTDAGPLYNLDYFPKMTKFPIPLPYANQSIYIGLKSTAAAAKTVTGRIGYILRRVSDKFFYRVAHALIS